MLKKYVTLIVFALFVFYSNNATAHTCPPGRTHGPGNSCPPRPPGLPIDGGVGILLIIGVGYAVRKIKDKD